MLRDDKHIIVLIQVFVGLTFGICASAQTDEGDARILQRGHLPEGVWFVPNEGQFHDEVRAEARVYGGDWWLTERGWKAGMLASGYDALARHESPVSGLNKYVLDVEWEGCSMEYQTVASHPSDHHLSYYRGNDPSKWARAVQPSGKLKLAHVWPGIHGSIDGMRGDASHIKCDWRVDPGADPQQIVSVYRGLETALQADGSLKHLLGPRVGKGMDVTGAWGHIAEAAPFAYQMNGSVMEEVDCSYRLQFMEDDAYRITYELGDYDASRPLIIDPEIEFASYIGSTADSWGFTAAYDDDGRLIGGSGVRDAGYPTTAGAFDATYNGGDFDFGISIFSADGTNLEYSTYLGGTNLDYPHSIVTNSLGEIYVMGTTGSADFPITSGAFQEAFVGGPYIDLGGYSFYQAFSEGCDIIISKIDGVDGALTASTFIGGSENDGLNLGTQLNYNYGDVCRGEVMVDPQGDVWLATSTRSDDFPMANAFDPGLNGPSDAVILRLSEDLEDLEFSSYFGGNQDDAAYAVQFAQGSTTAYVAGGTRSDDLPTSPDAYQPDLAGESDGYVFALNYAPVIPILDAVSYFGTDDYDQSYFVQLDTEDRPHLCGQTVGSSLQLVGDVYADNPNGSTFVVRFGPALDDVDWVTRIGLPQSGIDISPTAFLVSDCDEMYISGWGGVTNNNNSSTAGQSTTSGMPTTVDAYQIGTDGSDFWLGVLAPEAADLTYGTFFGGTFSNEHVDGGTSRFDKNGTVYQAVCAGCPTIFLCQGQGTFLEAGEGMSYLWSPAELVTNPLAQNTFTSPSENTTFTVQIANVCGVGVDSVSVELIAPSADATGGGWMCRGETMELSASDGVNYSWTPSGLAASPTAQSTQVFPIETTTFTVFVTDQFGCTGSTDITVQVWQPPYVDAGPNRSVDWLDQVRLFGTVDADTLWWTPDDWLSCSDCLTPEVEVQGPQWFVLESISPEGCSARDSVFLDVFYPVYIPTAFTPNNDGVNDAFRIEGVEPRGFWLEIFNRWGDVVFYSEDPNEPWIGNNQMLDSDHFVPDGVYVWRMRYEMRDGPRLKSGTVSLVR